MNIRLFNYPVNQTIKGIAPALALIAASCVLSNTHAIALSTLYIGYQWLSRPVSVKIYSLQKRGNLSPYAEKVEQLRGRSDVLGIAFLPDEKVIYLTKRLFEGNTMYRAFDLTTRQEVGEAITNSTLSLYEGGIIPSRVIHLDHIENLASGSHKNVGSVLIKTILQDTWNKHEGRIQLFSFGGAHRFYLKLGFHPALLSFNILDTFTHRSIEWINHSYSGGWMYLPADARALWREEIEDNPIFI